MRGKGRLEAGGVGPRGPWGPRQGTEADVKSQRQQRKDFKLGLYLRSLLRLALARRTLSLGSQWEQTCKREGVVVSRVREDAGVDELTGSGDGDEGRGERTRLEGSSPPAPSWSYDAQREVESLLSCPPALIAAQGAPGGQSWVNPRALEGGRRTRD